MPRYKIDVAFAVMFMGVAGLFILLAWIDRKLDDVAGF